MVWGIKLIVEWPRPKWVVDAMTQQRKTFPTRSEAKRYAELSFPKAFQPQRRYEVKQFEEKKEK